MDGEENLVNGGSPRDGGALVHEQASLLQAFAEQVAAFGESSGNYAGVNKTAIHVLFQQILSLFRTVNVRGEVNNEGEGRAARESASHALVTDLQLQLDAAKAANESLRQEMAAFRVFGTELHQDLKANEEALKFNEEGVQEVITATAAVKKRTEAVETYFIQTARENAELFEQVSALRTQYTAHVKLMETHITALKQAVVESKQSAVEREELLKVCSQLLTTNTVPSRLGGNFASGAPVHDFKRRSQGAQNEYDLIVAGTKYTYTTSHQLLLLDVTVLADHVNESSGAQRDIVDMKLFLGTPLAGASETPITEADLRKFLKAFQDLYLVLKNKYSARDLNVILQRSLRHQSLMNTHTLELISTLVWTKFFPDLPRIPLPEIPTQMVLDGIHEILMATAHVGSSIDSQWKTAEKKFLAQDIWVNVAGSYRAAQTTNIQTICATLGVPLTPRLSNQEPNARLHATIEALIKKFPTALGESYRRELIADPELAYDICRTLQYLDKHFYAEAVYATHLADRKPADASDPPKPAKPTEDQPRDTLTWQEKRAKKKAEKQAAKAAELAAEAAASGDSVPSGKAKPKEADADKENASTWIPSGSVLREEFQRNKWPPVVKRWMSEVNYSAPHPRDRTPEQRKVWEHANALSPAEQLQRATAWLDARKAAGKE